MSIRELEKRKSELRDEYERACREIDDQILAIRRKRDPNYDRKQQEKLQKGWEGYRELGRDRIPLTPYG
jgi:hypothetical protein